MRYAFFIALLTLATVSCRKSERDNDRSTACAEDEMRSQCAFMDVFTAFDEAAVATQGIRAFTTHLTCATITTDTLATPRIMTIDFGTVNCPGTDGRTRRGKLYCTVSGGLYSDSLTVVTVYPLNYYVNDHKIDGTITITNKGTNPSGQPVYALKVTGGKIISPTQGWTISWDCSYVLTKTTGQATAAVDDDEYGITGTTTANGRHGDAFKGSVQTALLYRWNCGEIVSGNNDVTPANINIRHIDYGSGTCDSKARVTIQGFVYEIHNLY